MGGIRGKQAASDRQGDSLRMATGLIGTTGCPIQPGCKQLSMQAIPPAGDEPPVPGRLGGRLCRSGRVWIDREPLTFACSACANSLLCPAASAASRPANPSDDGERPCPLPRPPQRTGRLRRGGRLSPQKQTTKHGRNPCQQKPWYAFLPFSPKATHGRNPCQQDCLSPHCLFFGRKAPKQSNKTRSESMPAEALARVCANRG